MDSKRLVKISKFLAKTLRHDPGAVGLTLDPDGWVEVRALRAAMAKHNLRITQEELDAVVNVEGKKRYFYSENGQKVRAAQGHSVAVDLGYTNCQPPAELFHGTVKKSLDAIMTQGLKPMNRQHVHLSADLETATTVGARRGQPVILTVDAGRAFEDGHQFFLADNGVWLCADLPAKYLRFV